MNESVGASVLNTKCNPKHCTLEYLIKQEDPAQDMSRAGILKRSVIAGETVEDWMPSAALLTDLKLEKNAPQFSNFQAKFDVEIREKLEKIKKKMKKSLMEGGIISKVLQTQYMLQLLEVNYLESLREARRSLKAEKIDEDNISLPEMSAIFTEMILTDRDCPKLKDIRNILIEWRKANEESI